MCLAILFLAMFFAVAKVTPIVIARYPRWRVESVSNVVGAPALLLVATLVMTLATPFQSAIVRSAETYAGAFGLDVARQPDAFAMSATGFPNTPATEGFLFFDPSGEVRIRRAMQCKKGHVPGATIIRPVLRH